MSKKLLITGFDPFGGDTVNPSWEAVRLLPDKIGDYDITKIEIPTIFGDGAQKVLNTAAELVPDVIICVGQAGGRMSVTPEVIGINLREARIADNAGNQPLNIPIISDAPAAYFSTIPIRKMADAINKIGIPASLSYSAGAFVCNDVLYTLLNHYDGTPTQVGFIHVPYLPEQAGDKFFSLPLEKIRDALEAAIGALE